MENELNHQLERIFNPKSIAVVGASEREYNLGYRWLQTLQDVGFPALYPVNPKGGEMLGLKVYPSISDIPGDLDLALLLIPRQAVPQVAQDCAAKGAAGIVLYTSGFGEAGHEGKALEREIVSIARQGGTRIMGPSCLGPYNPSAKLITQYPHPREAGAVGVISHSGFLFNFLIGCVTRTGIGPSKGVSCGSDCDLTFVDFLEYLGSDTQTEIIVAYVEGIRDGKRLLDIARRISRDKPIIVLKGGDTDVGMKASASHTGTLAVPSEIWDSICRQTGIITVDSFEEMMDLVTALYYLPKPAGRRVGIITSPGGLAVTAADACRKLGLEVPNLTSASQERLADLAGTLGTNLKNPVDLGPMGAMAAHRYVTETIPIVLADPNIDMLLVALIGPKTDDDTKDAQVAETMLQHIRTHGKPTVFSGSSLMGWDRGELKFLARAGVPVYPEARRAAYALSELVRYSEFIKG